ncbi:MAG: hypothetical protein V7K48_34475 [Nostoc sp.]|uniref:hypothetical protein n=1 Tax=Nostoc sp. TaxID=1180 RepID=UPI002FFABCD1
MTNESLVFSFIAIILRAMPAAGKAIAQNEIPEIAITVCILTLIPSCFQVKRGTLAQTEHENHVFCSVQAKIIF